MRYAIGIDIGGSHIEALQVNSSLAIKRKMLVKLPAVMTKRILLEKLRFCIQELGREKGLAGIGVGVPGVVWDGIVLKSPNLPYLESTNLRMQVAKMKRTKVAVENDVRCMAFAEMSRRKEKDIVVLTLGTGIGGGIISGGRLLRGHHFAGEVGHMTIEKDGLPCECGNRGCFEMYASARGVRRLSRRIIGRFLEPVEVSRLAQKGNRKAIRVWHEYGKVLGAGLSNLCFILDPERIVLGGGISGAYKFFSKSMKSEMERRLFIPLPRFAIGMQHGNAIGAAATVLRKME